MTKNMYINGAEKEVKFVEVTEETGTLKIFFTDYSFVMVEDVKIIVRED
jgi:hypothetical protein